MNQEKIGKFIAESRKNKKLTQLQLAEKLGVTDRAISKWENGKCMPDLSLFMSLCDELDITVNELLSGERIAHENNYKRFEENITNTINYSSKQLDKYNHLISLILIIFGLFISISAIMIFPSESSWGSIYSSVGIIIFILGIYRTIKTIKWSIRLLITVLIFIGSMGILIFTDYLNVKYNTEAPMFRTMTTYVGNVIYYDTLFYDVYRCNFDKDNEYWVIEKNNNPTIEELINYCNNTQVKS